MGKTELKIVRFVFKILHEEILGGGKAVFFKYKIIDKI